MPEKSIVDAECCDIHCERYGECKDFKVSMSDGELKAAVSKGMRMEGPGRIALACCPRYGASNPLCFILKYVNGRMTLQYRQRLEAELEKVSGNITKAQDGHRENIGALYRRLNAVQSKLDGNASHKAREANAD